MAAIFYEHDEDILNFYNNRASNATTESFNSEIKLFMTNLRGIWK
nr:transposase [uncultured Prevotella sp.]